MDQTKSPTLTVRLPPDALVVLVGPAGSGKSTFARRHFRPTEILSSDAFRAMLADDESDQRSSRAAFEILHLVAARRLSTGRLTVVDATNVQRQARRALLGIAAATHRPAVAIVFDLPHRVTHERNRERRERSVDPVVVDRHIDDLRRALATPDALLDEGFAAVHVLSSPEDADAVRIELESRQRRRSSANPGPDS